MPLAKKAADAIEAAIARHEEKFSKIDPVLEKEKIDILNTVSDPQSALVETTCEELREFLKSHPGKSKTFEVLRISCIKSPGGKIYVSARGICEVAEKPETAIPATGKKK